MIAVGGGVVVLFAQSPSTEAMLGIPPVVVAASAGLLLWLLLLAVQYRKRIVALCARTASRLLRNAVRGWRLATYPVLGVPVVFTITDGPADEFEWRHVFRLRRSKPMVLPSVGQRLPVILSPIYDGSAHVGLETPRGYRLRIEFSSRYAHLEQPSVAAKFTEDDGCLYEYALTGSTAEPDAPNIAAAEVVVTLYRRVYPRRGVALAVAGNSAGERQRLRWESREKPPLDTD